MAVLVSLVTLSLVLNERIERKNEPSLFRPLFIFLFFPTVPLPKGWHSLALCLYGPIHSGLSLLKVP